MARVVIVGGGISGLALAYRLEQRDPTLDVLVLERRERVGGVVATYRRAGFQVEAGPNGFLDSNPSTRELCADLGLADRLVAASAAAARNRFLLLGGQLRLLPTGLVSFLRSDVLSWRAKLNLLAERFRSPGRGGDESVAAFARRRVGVEVAETLVDAFVTGIYAGDPDLLSMAACFPRLAALERTWGSVQGGLARERRRRRAEASARGAPPPRGATLWSFREGLGFLIDSLHDRLRQAPLLGVAVRAVRRGPGSSPDRPRWEVDGGGRERWEAEAVVLTCPAYEQADLLAGLDEELAGEVAGVRYNGVVVAALGYRAVDVPRSLEGFGYLAPQRERRDVLGVQWCSSIFPDRAPSGAVLLRALCGGWNRPDIPGWEDGRLLEAVRAELRQALGITAVPLFQDVVRWERAIPQYHLGHLERVACIETLVGRHPGLFLGGNCYRGVALNDCVEQAGLLADRVLKGLHGDTDRSA